MHIQTHILSGWCVANCLPFSPRQRLLAMLAATLPDLDGLGIAFGQKAYWDYHHILGHNLAFAILLSIVLTLFARTRHLLCVGTFFTLVHLHLLMDYWGSGPGWPICYFWPFDRRQWINPDAWPFYSWQNIGAFFVLLGWTVAIAVWRRRTPLELLMPSLDRRLVGAPTGVAE